MITHDHGAEAREWCDFIGMVPPGWGTAVIGLCVDVERRVASYSPSELENWKSAQALMLKDGGALSLEPAMRQRVEDKITLAESLTFGKRLAESPAVHSATLHNWIASHSSNFPMRIKS